VLKFLHIKILVTVLVWIILIKCGAEEPTFLKRESEKKLSDNYYLYWNISNDTIYFEIMARTKGCVALGFPVNTDGSEADFIIGYVKESMVYLNDGFKLSGEEKQIPDVILGGSNDIIEFKGREWNNFTIIEFSRKLNTQDQFDYSIDPKKSNKVIWAIGDNDSINGEFIEFGTDEVVF